MWETINNFLNDHVALKITIDAYLLFIIFVFVLKFVLTNRKALNVLLITVVLFLLAYVCYKLDFLVSGKVFPYIGGILFLTLVIILVPEIRRELDFSGKMDGKGEAMLSSNDFTKNAIADATMYLSSHKIGALITIEKHNSLDQYAEKAIQLNSDVSKELLINIFTPNTPLHDGAVIIRGNKIRCAGAYYVLTKHEDLDKTTGSRHRAGLGISEVTDSLTVIVSEETGNISIASEGFMIKILDRSKLMEYLDMFLNVGGRK